MGGGDGNAAAETREAASLTSALGAFVECIVDVYRCAVRTQQGKDLQLEDKMYPMQLFTKSGTVDAVVHGIEISALTTSSTQDDRAKWCRSMKYILLNLKWLLAWAVRVSS